MSVKHNLPSQLDDKVVMEQTKRIAFAILHDFSGLNRDDKEDVLQESLIDASKGEESFGGRSQFTTWFATIVRRKAIAFVKRTKKRATESSLESLTFEPISEDCSAKILDKVQHDALLKDLRQTLNEKDYQILVMTYAEATAFTAEEIAPFVGMTASNVRQRLTRSIRPALKKIGEKYLK